MSLVSLGTGVHGGVEIIAGADPSLDGSSQCIIVIIHEKSIIRALKNSKGSLTSTKMRQPPVHESQFSEATKGIIVQVPQRPTTLRFL